MASPIVELDPSVGSVQTVEIVRQLILEEKAKIFDELFRDGSTQKTNDLIFLEAMLVRMEHGGTEITEIALVDEASGSSSSSASVEWLKKQLAKRQGLKKPGTVEKVFQIEHEDPEVFTILSDELIGNFGFEEVDSDFDRSIIIQEYDVLVNLPRSVRVVTWSGRPNLFQGLILGPNDSVYEDGLFVFNLLVPKNYPNDLPKVRHFYSNVAIGGEMENGGMLKESFVKRLWDSEGSLAGIFRGIQRYDGFFQKEEGSRTHCRRIWTSIYEIIGCPPPHFKKQIMSHFRSRLPYLQFQKRIDLNQKQLTQGEKDLVTFHWNSICMMLLKKGEGESSKGKKKWFKMMFKCFATN